MILRNPVYGLACWSAKPGFRECLDLNKKIRRHPGESRLAAQAASELKSLDVSIEPADFTERAEGKQGGKHRKGGLG